MQHHKYKKKFTVKLRKYFHNIIHANGTTHTHACSPALEKEAQKHQHKNGLLQVNYTKINI